MIHQLFPIPIYTCINTEFIEYGKSLFDSCPKYDYEENGFRTTLKEYSPGHANIGWNFLNFDGTGPLINFIKKTTIEFMQANGLDDCYEVDIPNIWLNEQESSGNLTPHSHYGYSYSGTYYINCPGESGKIIFHNPADYGFRQKFKNIKTYNTSNSSTWWIPVKEGTLILFPSYLMHSVPPQEFTGIRQSIAFDITVYPRIGI